MSQYFSIIMLTVFVPIIVGLLICIYCGYKVYQSEYSNWWMLAIFFIYYLCFHRTIGSLIVGLGYYLDPTGWGENNPFAMFLIKFGNLLG